MAQFEQEYHLLIVALGGPGPVARTLKIPARDLAKPDPWTMRRLRRLWAARHPVSWLAITGEDGNPQRIPCKRQRTEVRLDECHVNFVEANCMGDYRSSHTCYKCPLGEARRQDAAREGLRIKDEMPDVMDIIEEYRLRLETVFEVVYPSQHGRAGSSI